MSLHQGHGVFMRILLFLGNAARKRSKKNDGLFYEQFTIQSLASLGYAVYVNPFRQVGLQGSGATYGSIENALPQQVVQVDVTLLSIGQLNGERARGGVGVEFCLQGGGFGDACARLLRAQCGIHPALAQLQQPKVRII